MVLGVDARAIELLARDAELGERARQLVRQLLSLGLAALERRVCSIRQALVACFVLIE